MTGKLSVIWLQNYGKHNQCLCCIRYAPVVCFTHYFIFLYQFSACLMVVAKHEASFTYCVYMNQMKKLLFATFILLKASSKITIRCWVFCSSLKLQVSPRTSISFGYMVRSRVHIENFLKPRNRIRRITRKLAKRVRERVTIIRHKIHKSRVYKFIKEVKNHNQNVPQGPLASLLVEFCGTSLNLVT